MATYPPVPVPLLPGYAPFPPSMPTGLLNTIKSYLYQEYSDDDDLQAFVSAVNQLQQNYVDTFNGLNLPIYTQDPISGAVLDWVAAGVYGMLRPSLSSGIQKTLGPYNTLLYNNFKGVYNAFIRIAPQDYAYTNDDFFRRILTWHIAKGDGKYFSVRWLKRRVYQFLFGENGIQINDCPTYRISIQFAPDFGATIRIVLGNGTLTTAALYNVKGFVYNAAKKTYNSSVSTYTLLPPIPNLAIFQEAASSGVLELPFQMRWNIQLG